MQTGQRPTKSFLSYVAGLLDGEGCIRYGGCSERVSITSCYPHHLIEIRDTLGFGKLRKNPPRKPTDRTCYRLEMSGLHACSFVLAVLPFLREKKYQAELLLAIRTTPKNTSAHSRLVDILKSVKKVDYGV